MSVDEGRLRVLHLVGAWRRLEVAGCFEVALPADAESEAAAAKELTAFVISGRVPRGAAVVLGVPRAELVLRRVATPPVGLRSLPQLVSFEVERHLPGRREEYLFGWTVEGKAEAGGHGVLLGAARRASVERAASLLRRAGIAPTSVQPEQFALAGSLRAAEPALRTALLVSLGPGSFGVDCVAADSLALTRTFSIEGDAWRESLAAPGGEGEDGERRRAAAAAVGDRIAETLVQPVFLEALPGGRLPEVRLSGAGANRAHLIQRLAERLGVPVRVTSPWPQVRWERPPANLTAWEIPFALARLGVAGGGLELAEDRQEELHRAPSLRLTLALAAVLAAVLLSWGGAALLRDRRHLAQVEGQIRSLRGRMAAVEALNERLQEQRTRLEYLRATVEGRPRQAVILRELTALVPLDAYLSEYSFKEGVVEVSGFSANASRLLPILEESPLFAGVEFSAPIVAQGAGLERFRIRMRIEGAGG